MASSKVSPSGRQSFFGAVIAAAASLILVASAQAYTHVGRHPKAASNHKAQVHKKARTHQKARVHHKKQTVKRPKAHVASGGSRARHRDTTPPSAPSRLGATAGDTKVALSWGASTDNTGVAGYRVYRNGSKVAQTSSTSYKDSGLTDGTSYSYYVRAYDPSGNVSAESNTVLARPTATGLVQPPNSGTQSTTCGWGSFSDGPTFLVPSACWRPFSDASWLNTPLPANPKLAVNGVDGENGSSSALVASLMNYGSGVVRDIKPVVGTSWQHAMYFSSPSDPVWTLSCAHSTRNCNQTNSAVGEQIHIPNGATVPNGTDMQLFVIDQTSGYEYDLGGMTPGQVLTGGGTFYVSLATKVPLNGDGRFSCGADAACVGGSAGQLRQSELAAGSINHAIFIVNGTCDNTGTPTSLYPAVYYNSCGGTNPGAPKVGQWYYLALSDAQIAATGYPAWQQTILRALAHYGMFVGDQGSNGAFDIFTEDQGTWSSFKQANPWVGYAQSLAQTPANNIKAATSNDVDLGMDNIPHSFWTTNLRAVSPCVIQHTCT